MFTVRRPKMGLTSPVLLGTRKYPEYTPCSDFQVKKQRSPPSAAVCEFPAGQRVLCEVMMVSLTPKNGGGTPKTEVTDLVIMFCPSIP